ncbi:MAG: endo-1,4-beta-xylanase [Candidatus Magasanikbacteria bacterium]
MKRKAMFVLGGIFIAFGILYGVLWAASSKTYPIEYGISFNQNHAADLGLNWKVVYEDMLRELKPKYVRIAAMWNDVEAVKGQFDFSNVDWMMDKAGEYDAKIVLVVGQKAPRWPECHVPKWLDPGQLESQNHLVSYVKKVVEQYKDHKALEIWQIENEPFIRFRFGECKNFNSDVVAAEVELVRDLDPDHKVLITDSGELSTWRKASKTGDLFGTTMYRIIRRPNGKIFRYDWLPAAAYRWKAKLWGNDLKDVMIAELQAEPWFTGGTPTSTPVAIQEETMNPEQLQKHLEYATKTGFSRAYLWGVEWWYYMKEVHGDARYWNAIKEVL